jgi:hypothetical protein
MILHTLEEFTNEGVTSAIAPLMDLPRRFNTRLTRFDAEGRIGLNLDVTSVSPGLVDRLAGMGGAIVHAIHRPVREHSCDVIVDDLTYFDQPMFEDATAATAGTIAAAAQWAVDTGVVYVSSAGNWAKGGFTDRSHYQGDFSGNNPASNTPVKPLPAVAIPQPAPPGGVCPPFDNLHDFDPGAGIDVGLMVIMPPFEGGEPPELDVILEWNDAWGASANDYDLYLYDASMSVIKASSTTAQLGAQNAYEAVAYTNGYAVNTVKVTGGASQPTGLSTLYSVAPGNPYDDAGVQNQGCPTMRRWYSLKQSGGTNGQFDAVLTACVDESERQAAAIVDTSLRLLHWNGSWLDVLPQHAPPERVGNTWIVSADAPEASCSPYFVGHLVRGLDAAALSGGSGEPDSSVRVKFRVHNTGNGRDTLRCSISDTRGWTLSVTDSAFSLAGAAADTLAVDVTIGGTDTAGTLDTLVARSVADTTIADTACVTAGVAGGTVRLSVEMADGWNMVSAPVDAAHRSVTPLFPNAVSRAFRYNDGYESADSLAVGEGYWVKISGADTVEFAGPERGEDSVAVVQGWNMIGTITSPVAVGDVTELPGGIVLSSSYGYNGAYFTADSLRPGYSYWVKVSSAGKLVLAK